MCFNICEYISCDHSFQKSSRSRILLHSLRISFLLAPKWNYSPKLHMSNNFLLCFCSRLNRGGVTLVRLVDRWGAQWKEATIPWPCWRRFSRTWRHWRWRMRSLHLSKWRRSCILWVWECVPFGEVSPVSLLLSSVEMSVKINDVSLQELFSEFAGLKFLGSVSSFKLEVFLLSDVSSDLSRHSVKSISINK